VVAMPGWLMVVIAAVMAVVIWRVGMASVRSFSNPGYGADVPDEPEDVDDLDVFLVCAECGTELKVSRLGALQIPRHCGEKMQVARRPSTS
jgi:hypothetical protein